MTLVVCQRGARRNVTRQARGWPRILMRLTAWGFGAKARVLQRSCALHCVTR